jgi:formylglycine-generating enzyme required for sulfatase activity/tetratricopeptide (TPR) repeat protein
LQHFLAAPAAGAPSVVPARFPAALPSSLTPLPSSVATPTSPAAVLPSDSTPIRVVPRGLRSFEAQDADFFLELLPGPRDRQGLPDSIRFWKTRIEETDPDSTFAVGLIYGPSGCGKSSLVKAGLLPRLADHILPVYMEATADQTEARLLAGLRKHCPAVSAEGGLKGALAALRRGQGLPSGKKVLLVLDQFEQWLHASKEEAHTELVQSLRQCDGRRVQCVVLVRDDFWMAITRFLAQVEIELVQGRNVAAVDLFPIRHAERVLSAFGRAFGALPEEPGNTTREQQQFVTQAIAGLAEEGKVISVRLALFAEMMKGQTWSPSTLKEVGGTAGVGVAFMEEKFSSRTANPRHRLHQKAARAVLKVLLPEAGTDIKGSMRSHAELLVASGYANNPKDFDDLIRILDAEVRLITPTDPEGTEKDSTSQGQPGPKYYQLTHDYLVPSLRDWLTRKQKETRRGRAELLLADRAVVWNARPENRQLPSLLQWLNIRWQTRKRDWTPPQRKMMRKAARYHGVRSVTLAILLAVLTGSGLVARNHFQEQNRATHAAGLVQRLLDANIAQVPGIIAEIEAYREWTDPLLREQNDREAHNESPQKLHTSLALLPVDADQKSFLYNRLLNAAPHEVPVLRDALAPYRGELVKNLWAVVEYPAQGQEGQRLRAASALASYDPDSPQWAKVQEQVASDLVAVPAFHLAMWMDSLQPVRGYLQAPLAVIFRDTHRRETERSLATDILADYAADQPNFLADLLMDADEKQFAVLYPKLKGHGDRGLAPLKEEMDRQLQPQWHDSPLDPSWKRPDAALVQKLEGAKGILAERFAFCQTLALDDFLILAERLRPCGYRPIRFRPYAAGQAVQVAAIWLRDGRPWHLVHGLSAEDMRQQNAEHAQHSFWPVDVAGYLSGGKEHHAALWVQATAETEAAQLAVGLEESLFQKLQATLSEKGYRQAVYSFLVGADGKNRFSLIWATVPKSPDSTAFSVFASAPQYSGEIYPGELQVDVMVGKAGPVPGTRERFTKQLQDAEKQLQATPEDGSARFRRAVAYCQLGDKEKALVDLSWLIGKYPNFAAAYRHRAIVYARLRKSMEAKADLARFVELGTDASEKAHVDAIVAAYLGEEAEGMKRLESAITADSKKADFLYNAACTYSVASSIVEVKDAARAKGFVDRAVALLKEAVAHGYSDYSHMQSDADLDPLRQDSGFVALMQAEKLERRYTAVWHPSKTLTSVEVHGLDPGKHLARCRELMVQGYRPAALSVDDVGAEQALVTASVWQRPLVPEETKEGLAKRQANAAVTLLRLDQAERVWPVLKHSPDPRVRSYLIHRFRPLGTDPNALVKRLEDEPDVSIRRALLLSLGEFGEKDLPLASRKSLLPILFNMYQDNPDPGLHAAAEWLLRRFGQQDKLREMEQAWTKDGKKREERLARIRQELARNKGQRQWYVNGQGQTMVVLPGPVEFLMGSPGTEAERLSHERLHRRRIGRSFAIAATSVTLGQFWRFRPQFSHSTMRYYPEPTCPMGGVTWYEAAAYCNWLSEQEGMPQEQWCYETDGKWQVSGLRANYLGLGGYRLPTEAEWEWACRAGTLTSRYYGEAEELLGKYGWYLGNSKDRTWPVGALKPNDWGFFDMHGNVWNWCQERYSSYKTTMGSRPTDDIEDILYIKDANSRVLRGGSFLSQSRRVRSAYRYGNVPSLRIADVGLRPARTFP